MCKYFCNIFLFLWGITIAFSQAYDGYTLFTPQIGLQSGSVTYLMDNDKNIIQSWQHENGPASMAYLIPGDEPGLENTLLIYPFRVDNPSMESGGVGGGIHCLTWDGTLVWEFILANETYQHHHDVEPLPNGNVLLIAWEKKTSSEAYAMGREVIDNPLNQMWSSAIFEIQPNNNGGADVVWEWHLWDHLVQDFCSDCPNFAVVSEHPQLFDINKGDAGSASGPAMANADWIHLNAIDYHEEWDQIAVSSRYMSEIYVIDHSTTTEEAAGHTGGNYGKGGDFLYRWGNPQNYNRGAANDQMISDQHSINWIPYNYPGENNFILFNNYHSGSGPWGESAVLELELPVDENGNYFIEEDEPFGPQVYAWEFEDGFFTAMQGGSFRLPNGNTFITDCDSGHIFEVSSEGEVVWEHVESESNATIARAQKYAPDQFDDNSNNLAGDLNGDGVLNILDIVTLVNLVLAADYDSQGDLNDDNTLNILDIVILANLILSS